jgi:hypothetical protein
MTSVSVRALTVDGGTLVDTLVGVCTPLPP